MKNHEGEYCIFLLVPYRILSLFIFEHFFKKPRGGLFSLTKTDFQFLSTRWNRELANYSKTTKKIKKNNYIVFIFENSKKLHFFY